MGDGALHLRVRARLHSGNRREMGLVLIAQRQMQQQIGTMMDAELGEFAQCGRRDFCGSVQFYIADSLLNCLLVAEYLHGVRKGMQRFADGG
jgi:hypothetical protein